MSLIKKLIMAIALVFAILAFISFFMESSWQVERSVVIDAPKSRIFPYLNRLKNWYLWTPWTREIDSTLEWSYEGPDAGVGAIAYWEGLDVARGRVEIIKSDPAKGVEYTLLLGGNFQAHGELSMKEVGQSVEVTWRDSGDVGWNVLARLMIDTLDQAIGPQFETGLNNLKETVEKNR